MQMAPWRCPVLLASTLSTAAWDEQQLSALLADGRHRRFLHGTSLQGLVDARQEEEQDEKKEGGRIRV